jgi:hypothetical protein
MKVRAVIKNTNDWQIGWLVGLPEVNAQGKTHEMVIESGRLVAQEMLAAEAAVLILNMSDRNQQWKKTKVEGRRGLRTGKYQVLLLGF